MMKCILTFATVALCVGLFYLSIGDPVVQSPISVAKRADQPISSDYLTLNAPVPIFQSSSGQELPMRLGVDYQSFIFDANSFNSLGLDNFDRTLLGNIKATSDDKNINITPDRRRATLTNGQTVYYGVKIAEQARPRVSGVTFVLTTVPKSGSPDLRKNFFEIKYVESVGGAAGSVKTDSTQEKAYQVITPNGDYWYYFSFKAVVETGGIETTIAPVFMGGPIVAATGQKYIVCCWEEITTPLLDVPKCIPISWWYCIPIIDLRAIYAFQCCLMKKIAANAANVACTNPEAKGKELTILGAGFSQLPDLLGKPLEQSIHVTDEVGQVATVTSATIVSDNEIKAVIDVDRCSPGTKCVTIDGAQGYGNTTFLEIVNDMPSTEPCRRTFGAVVVRGTCDRLLLTLTTSGTNVQFDASSFNVFDMGCLQSVSKTQVSFTTTGGPTNTASYIYQGTAITGTQMMSEYLGTVSDTNLVTSTKAVSNDQPDAIIEGPDRVCLDSRLIVEKGVQLYAKLVPDVDGKKQYKWRVTKNPQKIRLIRSPFLPKLADSVIVVGEELSDAVDDVEIVVDITVNGATYTSPPHKMTVWGVKLIDVPAHICAHSFPMAIKSRIGPPEFEVAFTLRIDKEERPPFFGTVRTIVSGETRKGGEYTDQWDGKDDKGQAVPLGTYVVRAVVQLPDSDETCETYLTTGVHGVTALKIMRSETTVAEQWTNDGFILGWEDVVFRNKDLKIKAVIEPALTSLKDFPCQIQVRTFSDRKDPQVWKGITIDGDDLLSPNGKEIWITVKGADVITMGLLPSKPEDGINEFTSADNVKASGERSNHNDGDGFDATMSGAGYGWNRRGKGRDKGNVNATPPECPVNKEFLKAGGVIYVEVRSDAVASQFRQIQNQADRLYYSGHGYHDAATLTDDFSPTMAQTHWREDLEIVFIAGCAVLDINDYNKNYDDPESHAASPGEAWATTGPKVLLGYNWIAPLDEDVNGDADFTRKIIEATLERMRQGYSPVAAWMDANQAAQTSTIWGEHETGQRPWNACAIDLRNGEYWYFNRYDRNDDDTPKRRFIPRAQW